MQTIFKNIKFYFITTFLLVIPVINVFAQDDTTANPDQTPWSQLLALLQNANFGQILINIQKDVPDLVQFFVATAYVLGVSFVLAAVHELRIYGQPRMMMPAMASVTGPLGKMAIGAFLLFLPGTMNTLLYTLWGHDTSSVLISWDSTPTNPNTNAPIDVPIEILNAATALVRLFGYIAIIHGFVILSRVTKQQAQPGMFGKGIIQIIGGILAVNIIETVTTVWNTLFGG